MRVITVRSALFASAALFIGAAPALAQDAGPAPVPPVDEQASSNAQTTDAPASATDGDIVVTARRRAESLQDVPIAVSA